MNRIVRRARPRVLALLFCACVVAAPAFAFDAPAPGDAPHAPDPSYAAKPERSGALTGMQAEGLYSYTTPFAPPRWVRIQQVGDVVWGTIDINDSFGMCTRQRLDGAVSGNVITFYVPLEDTFCPCNGPNAGLTFTGTLDGTGLIHGDWDNACGAEGSWDACTVPEPSAPESAGICFLPDNEAPPEVRQTPGGNRFLWIALGALLVTLAFPALARLGAARGHFA